MIGETFTDRFNRLTANMTTKQLCRTLDMTEGAVRKLRNGVTLTIELHRALRLCKELGISPWHLAGEREPTGETTPPARDVVDGTELRSQIEQLSKDIAVLTHAGEKTNEELARHRARLDALEPPAKRKSAARRRDVG